MKIERTKLKKSTTEVPADCRALIEKLKTASEETLYQELKSVTTWLFGKCELYHWADVLDVFDDVLEKASHRELEKSWTLQCDKPGHEDLLNLLLQVLRFTALLIEHSFSRHLYNSMEHLTVMLASCNMTVVLEVLNLLYVFSKRSNFISRLSPEKKQGLVIRLTHLAESWGGKDNGFGLAECCSDMDISNFPPSATTLHFEFYIENKEEKIVRKGSANVVTCIHMDSVDKSHKLPSELMEELLEIHQIPKEKQILLYTHIRLAHLFTTYKKRVQSVQARLQALAILVYSSAIQDNMNTLLYQGLIEELVDIVELKVDNLMEIKASALRTLTSIIHLERNPKLTNIIDATGAASYHGFLPVLVRSCIHHMTDSDLEAFPQQYATALFSFLYHLASYENGVEALVSCGMMESLLKVINWYGEGQEHITFVTRAVRVVDLITNLDMAAFQTHGGLNAFVNRLEHEIIICRKEQPFEIKLQRQESGTDVHVDAMPPSMEMEPQRTSQETSEPSQNPQHTPAPVLVPETNLSPESDQEPSTSLDSKPEENSVESPKAGVQCFPQRAALLKSMLNFLKKAIPDPSFAESMRHLMDGSLPKSLKHIISNAEYYGPSLFLLATDVVTVYVFQEPSLLSSLQDNGLTEVVLQALLIKDVPATREVLASLPNVFSALCLNNRGLESFVKCNPFDRLFKVLLSPDYLPAMRRRRSSDPFGDAASNLGNAMDELMRHQPSLRTDTTKAIIKLLEEVCEMGRNPKFICQKPQPKLETNTVSLRSPQPTDAGSSDEEEEEEEIASPASQSIASKPTISEELVQEPSGTCSSERQPIPLMDYVLNVMKFVESILSNNSTDDHCHEFVAQKGLIPLMGILGLSNLPVDFPTSPACQSVASVCKSILTLSREPQVLKQGLLHLNEILQNLELLHKPLDPPGGSVLLHELAAAANVADATQSPQATPLLHALCAAHAYIMMFVHVCRMGHTDIRTISVSHWGSELGLQVLNGLTKLYTSLVWESTVLLALCSEDILPHGTDFGKEDMDKILPNEFKTEKEAKDEGGLTRSSAELGSNGVSAAMESLSTSELQESPMEVNDQTNGTDKDGKKSKLSPALQAQVKQLKPLLSVSSRLGRALAELFGLLVKLSVGTPVRQRRSHAVSPITTPPSPAAQAVAKSLTNLLIKGLQWTPPPCSPVPKLRLTFLVCAVGFTSPMLFDEKKHPYHLMLHKFLSSGGLDALFQAFSWALSADGNVNLSDGLENPDIPDGTGEFLDAWLMLVEKMVNPKMVLESPHTLPAKSNQPGFIPFSPIQYLISTQKAVFNAVLELWNKKPLKVYGSRMSESILAILCHIIKGENVIKENLNKEKKEKEKAEEAPAAPAPEIAPPAPQRPEEPDMNQSNLQQLIDMGFTREHAADALQYTSNVEQATEYILTHPSPIVPALGMEMDLSEEDQMMRAIAMSLGENVVMSTDQSDQSTKEEKKEEETEKEKQDIEEPLDRAVLDDFTQNVLQGCLNLLDTLPETVYRVCDLLIVITQRNDPAWQNNTLSAVVEDIKNLSKNLLDLSKPSTETRSTETGSTDEIVEKYATLPEISKFATRIHLFSLLFEEMMMQCAGAVETSHLADILVHMLSSTQDTLAFCKDSTTPKWLAPVLLLLDQYEKVSVISKRRAETRKLLINSHTWKWFDDGSGRWCKYSLGNNKTIDDAYKAGETSIRFQAGRRRYTVQFGNTMIQVNEETGNRRPIMLALPTVEEKQQAEGSDKEKRDEQVDKVRTDDELSSTTADEKQKEKKDPIHEDSTKVLTGFKAEQIENIMRFVITAIKVPLECETIHAALRLTLRLTREHRYARLFAELSGPKLLLGLTQASSFQGFVSLVTLIFRHILEEPSSLRYCMEKVVKSAASGLGSGVIGVGRGSPGSQEMHYVLRVLAPAACRNAETFSEVAKESLRISLPPPSKRDEDESRFTGSTAAQILKNVATKQLAVTYVDSPIKDVICDLLDALAVKYTWKQEEANFSSSEVRPAQTLAEAIAEVVSELNEQQNGLPRPDIPGDLPSTEDEPVVPGEHVSGQSGSKEENKDTKSNEENHKQKPLIPKSAILRLLSEFIKSYSSCTQLITQYCYKAGQSDLITEDCSVLAFLLDNLLSNCQTSGDKDCPALARVFISSISACNHSPDAQLTLVNEMKGALQRALNLPESAEKHSQIQSLTNLVSTMIESCTTPGLIPNEIFKGQQVLMNNMVKSLIKRGIVTDLARIPHSLDLSSPYMANTINAVLKPLETLSRSVNQPLQNVTKTKSKTNASNSNPTVTEEIIINNPPDLIEDVVEAEDSNVRIEDVSDQVEQHEHLDQSEPVETVEPGLRDSQVESALQEVINELLHTETGVDPENRVLNEMIMDTDVVHDEDQSAESGSDVDDGDNDDDQDEDDDDDDDDDDDEGSDMEADDDYADIDAPVGANPGGFEDDNFFVRFEDMIPRNQYALYEAYDNSHQLRTTTYQLPMSMGLNDVDHTNDNVPAMPPAPSNVTTTHPLLVRQPDHQNVMSISRLHRGNRQRGACRYNPNTQTIHVNFSRQPNPPVILQRLLGPTTAADVLQLTNTLVTQAGPSHTRVVLANEDLRLIHRAEEDLYDELFHQDSYSDAGGSGSAVLARIPSTLTRWTEEARVLDGDSTHDCITILKPDILEFLEAQRDKELLERREKRKKAAEEESKKETVDPKNTNGKEDDNMSLEWDSPIQHMEVSQPSSMIIGNTRPLACSDATSTVVSSVNDGRPITSSEAAAAAEIIASAMVEEVLSTPMANPITTSRPLSRVMPPPPAPQPLLDSYLNPDSFHGITPLGLSNSRADSHSLTSNPTNFMASSAGGMSNLASLLMDDTRGGSLLEQARLPLGHGASLLESMMSNPATALSFLPPPRLPNSATGRSTDSVIRPEETFNITSSDAVTVHSSASGSIDELNNVAVNPDYLPAGSSVADRLNIDLLSDSLRSENLGGLTVQTGIVSHPQSQLGLLSELSVITSNPLPVISNPLTSSSLVTTAPDIRSTVTTASTALNPATVSQQALQSIEMRPGLFGDMVLPEGVDPSFLAALPDNIRQEVIAEQLRLQNLQQRTQQQNQAANENATAGTSTMEVNPEFLAALPPNIQEEVLAQQRAEQARLTAQQQVQTNPDTPVDPASFFATLSPALRQQLLAEMDDSMLAVLPADLAAEARSLRRELVIRHRRMFQERLFAQASIGSLPQILNATRMNGRVTRCGTVRSRGASALGGRSRLVLGNAGASASRIRGRHLLDNEALTCLLVLLFVDEPKLNTARLHKVLRNLCYHGPTRAWVIKTLLSILQKTGDCKIEMDDKGRCTDHGRKKLPSISSGTSGTDNSVTWTSETKMPVSWLSISQEAALGCRATVFQIQRTGKKHTSANTASVSIHPQASPVVCRHVLDMLISLAKIFPNQFLPSKAREVFKCDNAKENSDVNDKQKHNNLPSPRSAKTFDKMEVKDGRDSRTETNFWDLLIKLDNLNSSKKGKSVQKTHSNVGLESDTTCLSYETSPLGQLMVMLSHPVIRRSQLLTDRILRLLGLVSVAFQDMNKNTPQTSTMDSRLVFSNLSIPVIVNTTAPASETRPELSASEKTSQKSTSDEGVKEKPADEEEAILEPQLKLAVEVLTSKSCTEDGLEDATNFLLQLSSANSSTRNSVLGLLLEGTRELGLTVCCHIRQLLDDLRTVNFRSKDDTNGEDGKDDSSQTIHLKGLIVDRFSPSSSLVVSAPKKVTCGRDFQVPSMTLLTNKTSSQHFLLRLLKVIIQLRDAARTAMKKINIEQALASMESDVFASQQQANEQPSARIEVTVDGQLPVLGVLGGDIAGALTGQVQQTVAPALDRQQREQAAHVSGLQQIIAAVQQNMEQQERITSSQVERTAVRLAPQQSMEQEGLLTGRENGESQQIAGETISELEHPAATVTPGPVASNLDSMEQGAQAGEVDTTASVKDLQQNNAAQSSDQDNLISGMPAASMQASQPAETPMEVEQSMPSSLDEMKSSLEKRIEEAVPSLPCLSEQLLLEELWEILGCCLTELSKTPDHHAVLILQPAVEAFFIVHSDEKDAKLAYKQLQKREDQLAHLNLDIAPASPAAPTETVGAGALTRDNSVASVSTISSLPPDTQKFIRFAETHRTVLNQILRQSTTPLADGPFSVLVDHTRILDFDIKRRYFRQEIERLDEGMRREDLAVHVRREHVFEDSFRELFRRTAEEWKHRFYIVFEGEEGQDAGGLLREWYIIISREIFNPMYALFAISPGDRVTYTINPLSHCNSNHLSYFKFVGRIIAKAIYDNKLLECYFTRSFYKHIIGQLVKYTDMESEDYSFYQGLVFLLEHNVKDIGYDLTFSTEIQEFGVTEVREMKPGGHNVLVTEDNKKEYVKIVCQMKMTGAIRKQLNAFMEGFYDIIPKRLISIFNEQELELLISGLPTIDIDDLKANSEYHKYQPNSLQIQWFWRALQSFEQADRACFLQFVTGTSKVPLQGFAYLEGMNGIQKFQIHRDDRSTDRLPSAHTCFNQLDLPAYETYDKLKHMLLLAVHECSEGFGLA